MSRLSLLNVTRPNFLVLTPVCLSLGLATALWSGRQVDWHVLGIILLGALMAHVSVNALNEYADFRSGLDLKTRRTPFSGGSGTLPEEPRLAPYALAIGVGAYLVTSVCGIYLVGRAGWGLMPLGLAGLVVILLYNGPISRNRFLVLIAPGLGFGPLMVLGTHYVLTGEYALTALVVSLIPFFLVSNLLLLNQVPDVEADRSVHRDNFAIALPPSGNALIYGWFGFLAYLTLLVAALVRILPGTALLGLLTALLAFRVFRGLRDYTGNIEQIVPHLGQNVFLTLLTPLLVAVGIGLDTL